MLRGLTHAAVTPSGCSRGSGGGTPPAVVDPGDDAGVSPDGAIGETDEDAGTPLQD